MRVIAYQLFLLDRQSSEKFFTCLLVCTGPKGPRRLESSSRGFWRVVDVPLCKCDQLPRFFVISLQVLRRGVFVPHLSQQRDPLLLGSWWERSGEEHRAERAIGVGGALYFANADKIGVGNIANNNDHLGVVRAPIVVVAKVSSEG